MVDLFGNRNAFWQALIFTLIVFCFGIIMGFFIEDHRANYVNNNLLDSEISLLDEQLAVKSIADFNLSCDFSARKLFSFADDVYLSALKLEDYDGASTFTNQLAALHKRYDLLRLTLWLESIKVRKNCKSDFHTLVYLYDYKSDDFEKKAKQVYYSRVLGELKEKNKESILLIPIAVNMNLSSVDFALSQYNVTNFPNIIIDEREVVSDFISLEELYRLVYNE